MIEYSWREYIIENHTIHGKTHLECLNRLSVKLNIEKKERRFWMNQPLERNIFTRWIQNSTRSVCSSKQSCFFFLEKSEWSFMVDDEMQGIYVFK